MCAITFERRQSTALELNSTRARAIAFLIHQCI